MYSQLNSCDISIGNKQLLAIWKLVADRAKRRGFVIEYDRYYVYYMIEDYVVLYAWSKACLDSSSRLKTGHGGGGCSMQGGRMGSRCTEVHDGALYASM